MSKDTLISSLRNSNLDSASHWNHLAFSLLSFPYSVFCNSYSSSLFLTHWIFIYFPSVSFPSYQFQWAWERERERGEGERESQWLQKPLQNFYICGYKETQIAVHSSRRGRLKFWHIYDCHFRWFYRHTHLNDYNSVNFNYLEICFPILSDSRI